jgi:hypothetical protein
MDDCLHWALLPAVRRIDSHVRKGVAGQRGVRQQVIAELSGKRKQGFSLERAVFLTVLHRLLVSGSKRAADRWREDYVIAGVDGLIPSPIDQNPGAHWRSPMDMMRQG